jgi:hypothetical protein
MSERSREVGARLLILCWVIAIFGGFLASLVMSVQAFRDGNTVLCYRTYVARDQLRT